MPSSLAKRTARDGSRLPTEEHERWDPYRVLRIQLKVAVHMSFCDGARDWLESELEREPVPPQRVALGWGFTIRP
jgi:hypothetical protein